VQSSFVPIAYRALRWALPIAVTSCIASRPSEYVNSWTVTNWIKFSLSLVPAILHLQH